MARSERPWPALSDVPALQVAWVCMGILLVNGAVALWLSHLGRGFLPASGTLQWWSVSTLTADNSQHLMDPYSLLHAVSGSVLFLVAGALQPFWPVCVRLLLVIASSGVWEAVENTPWVIALFNDPHGIGGYRGDSMVNALSDTVFVGLGFLLAWSMSPKAVITVSMLIEVGVTILIHDGIVLSTFRLVR